MHLCNLGAHLYGAFFFFFDGTFIKEKKPEQHLLGPSQGPSSTQGPSLSTGPLNGGHFIYNHQPLALSPLTSITILQCISESLRADTPSASLSTPGHRAVHTNCMYVPPLNHQMIENPAQVFSA